MTAYGRCVMASNPNVELWALAVSTTMANAVAARDAGTAYRICALTTLHRSRPTQHRRRWMKLCIHRLETIDRPEYAPDHRRVLIVQLPWARRLPQCARSRAPLSCWLPGPPAIRQSLRRSRNGEPGDRRVVGRSLTSAMRAAILDSARASGQVGWPAMGPVCSMRGVSQRGSRRGAAVGWRSTTPDYVEIAYTARHYREGS